MADTDRMTKVRQTNTEALDELKATLDRRRGTYSQVVVNVVLQDEKRPILGVYFASFQFDDGKSGTVTEVSCDYRDLVLARRIMTVDAAVEVILNLLQSGRLIIPGLREAETEPRLRPPAFLDSNVASFLGGWPTLLYSVSVPRERQAIHDPLPLDYELPYFPTREDAIMNLLGARTGLALEPVTIFLPDYRGRIGRLHIEDQGVTVEVSGGSAPEEDLRMKIFARTEGRNIASENLRIRNGTAALSLDFEPDYVQAILLSERERDRIDERFFSVTSPFGDKDVAVDNLEAFLLQLIERGESVSLEFKQTLDTSKEGEYLETLVAFANTKGGTMIVGVDDNCRVVGWSGDVEQKLTNRVNELCDPPVVFEIRENTSLDGKPVAVIRVPEGKDRPYILKGRGVLVRRGSSDRQITRREPDKMYEEKPRPGVLLPGFPNLATGSSFRNPRYG